MASTDDEKARVFLRNYAKELTNGYKLVTVHMVVRDNRNRFFFVENQNQSKSSSANGLLNYKVIDFDTIVLSDYPEHIGENVPELEFYFSTDSEETKEFRDFELFIQFVTKKVNTDSKALVFTGKRFISNNEKSAGRVSEKETDKGIVYFPDVT